MPHHKSAHRARGPGQVLRRLVRSTCSDDIQGEDHENNGDNYDEGDSLVLSKVIQGDDNDSGDDGIDGNNDGDDERGLKLVESESGGSKLALARLAAFAAFTRKPPTEVNQSSSE